MNTLESIRRVLRNVQAQKMDKASDSAEVDGELGAMQLFESAGEHKVAAELLRKLPEPEAKSVRCYRAVRTLLEHDAQDEIDNGRVMEYAPEEVLRRLESRYKHRARNHVVDRLEVEETENGYQIKDPISKHQANYSGKEENIEHYKQNLAEIIIEP